MLTFFSNHHLKNVLQNISRQRVTILQAMMKTQFNFLEGYTNFN